MKTLLLRACVLAALLAFLRGDPGTRVAADDAPKVPPASRFHDGAFEDTYMGVSYSAPGLKEAPPHAAIGPGVFWAGEAEGGVVVELVCEEGPEPLPVGAWRTAATKGKPGQAAPEEVQEGAEPVPWVTFVRVGVSGYRRHHGYAFHVRGHQCLQVHVQVLEKSDTSGAALQACFTGLRVQPHAICFLRAFNLGRRLGKPPTDPAVLLEAGLSYLEEQPRIPALALTALRETARGREALDGNQRWLLVGGTGLAHLALGEYEPAVASWKSAQELAKAAADPGQAVPTSAYNLACSLARLRRTDEAFVALSDALGSGDAGHTDYLRDLAAKDADLESLRTDPRWKQVVAGSPAAK